MQVIHKVKFVYGSYSGTTNIRCDADDDLETIEAKVRRQEQLNYLAMATYHIEILDTQYLNY